MRQNRRKPKLSLLLISLAVALLAGWVTGILIDNNINTIADFFTFVTSRGAWLGMGCGVLAWVMFAVAYFNSLKPVEMMYGREHGTARFATPKEINDVIAVTEPRIPLSQSVSISASAPKNLSLNKLILGASGSGKTWRFIVPFLYNLPSTGSSCIVTDTKGQTIHSTGNYLMRHGYRLETINLINTTQSDSFNPFLYINSIDMITRLLAGYIRNTNPPGGSSAEPFWDKAELLLETATWMMLMLKFDRSQWGMDLFISLLKKAQVPEQPDVETELDKMFSSVKDKTKIIAHDTNGEPVILYGATCYEDYMQFRNSAVDTARSIAISAVTRFSALANSPGMLKIMSGHNNNIHIRELGIGYDGILTPTVLYIIVPDSDATLKGVIGFIWEVIFSELFSAADRSDGGKLDIPVTAIIDEAYSAGLPSNFTQLCSVCRSRNIDITSIWQSISQMKALYKDSYESLFSINDIWLWLGSQEESTLKMFCELLGKRTIGKESTNTPTGFSGSGSKGFDTIARELMTESELRMLPNDELLLFVRGLPPVRDKKILTEYTDAFKEASNLGPYNYQSHHDASWTDAIGGPLNSVEADYLSSIGITPAVVLTADELFAMDDDALDTSEADIDVITLTVLYKNVLRAERCTTLAELMTEFSFNDAQIEQAHIGLAGGLSEQQVMSYMRINNSSERMAMLRQLMLSSSI